MKFCDDLKIEDCISIEVRTKSYIKNNAKKKPKLVQTFDNWMGISFLLSLLLIAQKNV